MKAKTPLSSPDQMALEKRHLPESLLSYEAACPTFINAALITQGLSPFQPEAVVVRAARIVL